MSKHIQICHELNRIYQLKNKDYGNSFSKQFEEYGLVSSAIRIEDKLSRFKNLINNEQQVNDESIEDTLIDLANYAIMTVMELRNNKEDTIKVYVDRNVIGEFRPEMSD